MINSYMLNLETNERLVELLEDDLDPNGKQIKTKRVIPEVEYWLECWRNRDDETSIEMSEEKQSKSSIDIVE